MPAAIMACVSASEQEKGTRLVSLANLTITRNTFDPAGNLLSTIDPMSRVSSQLFNALNQVVTVRQPNPAGGGATGGPASSVVFNALGDVIQEIDAAGNVTDNSYDVRGDLLSTTGPAPTPGAAGPGKGDATRFYGERGDDANLP